MMKKCFFLIVLICSLLLCAAALADREISITTMDGVSGTIKVPDDVTVILEKGGPDGIIVTADGSRKTVTLTNYEVNAGTGGFPAAGDADQKVIVMELFHQTINTGKGTPLTCLAPMMHMGTMQSFGSGTLVLDSFEYSGDEAAGYAMTEDE